jgi:hypothetical protein
MLGVCSGESRSTEVGTFSANSTKISLTVYREHLLRRHERPYCPICLDQFDNYDARDMHVRERACQQVDGEQRGDWLEPDVVQKIRQRTKKGETPMEGWQRMYCIIFPDAKTVPPPCE